MQRTLLDLTQNILSALNSDEVNSISDTTESLQVAEIIKTTYYNMISRTTLPEHNQIFKLTASGDSSKPVLMYRPDNVSRIEWIKYFRDDDDSDTGDVFQYVTILPIQQFLDLTNSFDTTESNVDTFTFTDSDIPVDTFTFNFKNDAQPCYCCIIQNRYIIFDSFDSDVDTTLQESKTLCFGKIVPGFSMTDTFVPDLDSDQFPLLLNEAKALAFYELKQMLHQKAEQEVKRQWSSAQKNKSIVNRPTYFDQLPNFGRTTAVNHGSNRWMRQTNP